MASSTATTAAAKQPASSSTSVGRSSSSGPARRGGDSPAARAVSASGKKVVSAASGKKVVLLCTVGTGALSLVAAYRKKTTTPASNPFRIVLGVFIAGTLLAALAEFQPKLASSFAVLMLITAAFVIGGDAWQGIASVTAIGAPSSALANAPKTPAPIGK